MSVSHRPASGLSPARTTAPHTAGHVISTGGSGGPACGPASTPQPGGAARFWGGGSGFHTLPTGRLNRPPRGLNAGAHGGGRQRNPRHALVGQDARLSGDVLRPASKFPRSRFRLSDGDLREQHVPALIPACGGEVFALNPLPDCCCLHPGQFSRASRRQVDLIGVECGAGHNFTPKRQKPSTGIPPGQGHKYLRDQRDSPADFFQAGQRSRRSDGVAKSSGGGIGEQVSRHLRCAVLPANLGDVRE